VLVYRETGDPLATSALFVAAQFLPALAGPALTARVDQLALRRVLPALYAGEAAAFVLLAVLAGAFSLPLVLVLAAADGVLRITERALSRAATHAVLDPRGLLREGNALLNAAFAAASVGGAALGGLLVDRFGVATALLVDAGSFAVIAVVLATARGLPAAHTARQPLRERLRAGVRHARGDRLVRLLLAGEGIAVTLFSLVVPVEIVYAQETLGTDEAGYGLLLAAWGAGIVLGSATYFVVRRRSAVALVLLSTLAVGAGYLGMAATTALWVACAFSVLGGAGNGVQWVAVLTALQEATPPDMQARVTSLLESIGSAATGIGFLLGGAIAALFSPPAAFAAAGAGVVVLVAAGAVALRVAPGARRESPAA
jgi:predicted MFS family arabinose efflux permease